MAGLCVRLLKNERLKIGTRFVRLAEIKGNIACMLEVEGAMKQQIEVTTRRSVEILPGVTAVMRDAKPHRVEMQIVAPPNVRIERLRNSAERFADA